MNVKPYSCFQEELHFICQPIVGRDGRKGEKNNHQKNVEVSHYIFVFINIYNYILINIVSEPKALAVKI